MVSQRYSSYGAFPLRDGWLVGYPTPDERAVMLSWGLWEPPRADNDSSEDASNESEWRDTEPMEDQEE